MQNVHLKCWNDKSHCQVSVVGLKSLDVSPCNELLLLPMINKNSLAWEYFFTHRPKSTFGVHYRTGSPGQLGHRVAGFPGHWVTKCYPVPSLLPRYVRQGIIYTAFVIYTAAAAAEVRRVGRWRCTATKCCRSCHGTACDFGVRNRRHRGTDSAALRTSWICLRLCGSCVTGCTSFFKSSDPAQW